MTTKRKLTRQFDQVWGIDRYKASPFYGKVESKTIHLWNAPAAVMIAANLTGALAHGAFVRVVNRRIIDGHHWYKVAADVKHEDKTHHQRGWVVDRLLRKRGKGAFE